MSKQLTADQLKLRNHVLEQCVARIESTLGVPSNPRNAGTKREAAALDYLCGATVVMRLLDSEVAQNLELNLALIFCVRGSYTESKRMLADKE